MRTSQDLEMAQLLLCSANHKAADAAAFRLASGGGNLKGSALLYLEARCRHLLPSHALQKPFLSSIALLKGDLISV